jgi:mRNA interferase RelE/StbE
MESLSSRIRTHLLARIEEMSSDLKGDVKRLTNFTPEYRLRVGDYRVLFEIEDEQLVIYRIRHRREAYR